MRHTGKLLVEDRDLAFLFLDPTELPATLPPTLGYYRSPWAGHPGREVSYRNVPFFGRREVGLPMVKRDVLQVQVVSLGQLAWININEDDLLPV